MNSHLNAPVRFDSLVRRVAPGTFLLKKSADWIAVPAESQLFLGGVERERLISVAAERGGGALLAVSLEGDHRRAAGDTESFAPRLPELERFNYDFGGFDCALALPDATLVVLCAADDYLVWFGSRAAVSAILGDTEDAVLRFANFVRRTERTGRELQFYSGVYRATRVDFDAAPEGEWVQCPRAAWESTPPEAWAPGDPKGGKDT